MAPNSTIMCIIPLCTVAMEELLLLDIQKAMGQAFQKVDTFNW